MTKSNVIALITVVTISVAMFFFLSWKLALAIVCGALVVCGVVTLCRSYVFQMLWEALRSPKEYSREIGEDWDY